MTTCDTFWMRTKLAKGIRRIALHLAGDNQ